MVKNTKRRERTFGCSVHQKLVGFFNDEEQIHEKIHKNTPKTDQQVDKTFADRTLFRTELNRLVTRNINALNRI